jgi:hypothetical protein
MRLTFEFRFFNTANLDRFDQALPTVGAVAARLLLDAGNALRCHIRFRHEDLPPGQGLEPALLC